MQKFTEELMVDYIYKKTRKTPDEYGFIGGTMLPFDNGKFMGMSKEHGYQIWKLKVDGTKEILTVDHYLNTEADYRKHLEIIINFLSDAKAEPELKIEYRTLDEIIDMFNLNTLEAAEVYVVARKEDRSTIAWWVPKQQLPYLSKWKKDWDEKFVDMILYGSFRND
jgi:hypothetical protein